MTQHKLLLLLILIPKLLLGQQFFRIEGNFSIKEKSDLNAQLTIGRFYYDVNIQKIVYDVSFPEKQTLILYDTTFYQMNGTQIIKISKAANIAPFSIYHLALTNTLTNFGLDGSIYEIEKVENDNGQFASSGARVRIISR